MLLPVLAVVSTISTQPGRPDRTCDGAATTTEVDACLSRQLSAVRSQLAEYVALARTRAGRLAQNARPGSGYAKTPAAFDRAETAWRTYADAECAAVFDAWSGSTIRGAMELSCSVRLTRLHTVWRHWLTFPDSTPPLLPEPPVPLDP